MEGRGFPSEIRSTPVPKRHALQVEKAKKREETAAVAVLELMLPGGPSRSKFLLLQRPKEGLLAGVCCDSTKRIA